MERKARKSSSFYMLSSLHHREKAQSLWSSARNRQADLLNWQGLQYLPLQLSL